MRRKGSSGMIGVLDYGIGNIGSILNMIRKVGAEGRAVTTGDEADGCDKLILPGVGAFDVGMALLNQSCAKAALPPRLWKRRARARRFWAFA